MTFDKLYKKVINASKAFEERRVPISLDIKIEDLRDALVESNVTIEKLKDENRRLKEMMPEYKQFIKDKKFRKELVDEYDGYVYEWMGHRYIATPYINIFIKGILRALWISRTERAQDKQTYYTHMRGDGWVHNVDKWIGVERKCRAKAEEYK